jgi:hypothetical protein
MDHRVKPGDDVERRRISISLLLSIALMVRPRHGRIVPSDSSETFCLRLSIRGVVLPEANNDRKSERCTATRLIDPFNRTSTMRHAAPSARIT